MYYIVKDSLDEKTVGTDFPQTHDFIKGYKMNAHHALDEFYDSKKKHYPDFPDFIPDLGGMKLSGRAKLTDWVSTSFGGALITPRFHEILEKYNLCPHRFYPVTLYARNVPHEYFYLHIISDYSDFVDYKKSTFVERNSYETRGTFFVDSKEDMLKKREEIENRNKGTTFSLWGDNIIMNSEFNRELDFFKISRIDANMYSSKRLVDDIIKNNLTGLKFIVAEKLSLCDENK
jgi:hypothetical protein